MRAWPALTAATIGMLLSGCYSGMSDFDPNELGGGLGADSQGQGEDAGEGDDEGEDSDGEAVSCEDGPQVGASPLRRLTRFEYDNTVRDLLGDTTRPGQNTFSPDEVYGGYAANAVAPIAKTQLDEYAAAAEELSATFIETGLGQYVDCPLADTACATQFVTGFGRQAFRRPLEAVEVDEYVALYEDARGAWDGATGFRLVVEAMLLSPNFLYHVETTPEGADESAVVAVDPYALATRASYFVWASTPDQELLDAAEAGELDTPEGLEAQIRRMLDDPKAADTIASFTQQWMHLEGLADKVKDAELYPQWGQALADSMEHEALAFADEVIRNGDGSLATLLTADWTMADDSLADIYGVAGPQGGFGRIDLPADERAGLLTQVGFLTTNAHAAENSWVHRGLFVRENLLCQTLPAPPIGVEVNDANDAGRLEDENCSGCHLLMDPIGWAFDDYDPIGLFTDEGEAGEVRGSEIGEFSDIPALASSLAADPGVHDCVATQWFRYAARRDETPADSCALDQIKANFAESGQDIRELIIAVAKSEAFRYRKASE